MKGGRVVTHARPCTHAPIITVQVTWSFRPGTADFTVEVAKGGAKGGSKDVAQKRKTQAGPKSSDGQFESFLAGGGGGGGGGGPRKRRKGPLIDGSRCRHGLTAAIPIDDPCCGCKLL